MCVCVCVEEVGGVFEWREGGRRGEGGFTVDRVGEKIGARSVFTRNGNELFMNATCGVGINLQ